VSVDSHIGPDLIERLQELPGVKKVEPLRF
jgi:hypothetical protein